MGTSEYFKKTPKPFTGTKPGSRVSTDDALKPVNATPGRVKSSKEAGKGASN